MKAVICLMFACVLMAATAQAQAPARRRRVGRRFRSTKGSGARTTRLKMNLTETAQKFDEADYGYTPSPDIRVFGAQLAHVANSQFNACAAARARQTRTRVRTSRRRRRRGPTSSRRSPTRLRSAIAAFANLTDQSALELVKQGQNEVARGSAPGQPHRARQRRVRHPDRLHAHEGNGSSVDRTRHARAWGGGEVEPAVLGSRFWVLGSGSRFWVLGSRMQGPELEPRT